jgi:hypothetical protein
MFLNIFSLKVLLVDHTSSKKALLKVGKNIFRLRSRSEHYEKRDPPKNCPDPEHW